jgi:hypothetical protein
MSPLQDCQEYPDFQGMAMFHNGFMGAIPMGLAGADPGHRLHDFALSVLSV